MTEQCCMCLIPMTWRSASEPALRELGPVEEGEEFRFVYEKSPDMLNILNEIF